MLGLNSLRRRWILKHADFPEDLWRSVLHNLPMLRGLAPDERIRLKELLILFLHEKAFEGAGGLEITDAMRLSIGVQACLPILNLGLSYYEGWVAVIVYPSLFRACHEYLGEDGVVQVADRRLSGEAWLKGPVILSWDDAQGSDREEGWAGNAVVHEFAHKLDMLNGKANGMPPLHKEMKIDTWTRAFTRAYTSLCAQVEQGKDTVIDPYAAESPAEFFAVMSEVFFVDPYTVSAHYPAVYAQLRAFYRQDLQQRLSA
jgi:Uncharacterized protein conserved in bacteria